MGGLWCGFTKDEKSGGLKFGDPKNMMTNVPGLYAMGEANFAYHGANRLGANSLLSCIFDGLFGGTCIKNYITDAATVASADVSQNVFDALVKQETDKQSKLLKGDGPENPYKLWQEMGKWMTDNCTVVRHNDRLERTIERCGQWKQRYERISLSDTGMWTNQNLSFARALGDMIIMADAILKAAVLRNESRGAHFKPEYPDRHDDQFLKTTVATYDAHANMPVINYEPVDTSLIPPRARTYGKKPDAAPSAKPTASQAPTTAAGVPAAAAT